MAEKMREGGVDAKDPTMRRLIRDLALAYSADFKRRDRLQACGDEWAKAADIDLLAKSKKRP